MADFGLFDTGLSLPRQADYLAIIKSRYAELTGESPDWDRDEVLGTLLALSTFQLDQQAQLVQSIYDAWDENNATGVQLENIAALFPGISRKVATPSTCVLTLSGTPGAVIPSGSVVEGGGTDSIARWSLLETVTVTVGGTVEAEAENVVSGPVEAQAGAITKIVTPVAGWSTVTNAAPAVPGTDRETDDGLRRRRRESLQVVGGRSLGAILGNVLALPFITDATVIENTDGIPQVVKGVTLPAHSYSVVVQPDVLTTVQQEDLAKVLYNTAPVGIEIVGTQTATVTGADGLEKDVAWDHPAPLLVTTQWAIRTAAGFSATATKDAVQQFTFDYFATLGVADPVRRLDMLTQANLQIPGLQQAALTLNLSIQDVEPGALQVATFNPVGSVVVEI